MRLATREKLLSFFCILLVNTGSFSCLKDTTSTPSRLSPPIAPIVGKWSLISDSVGVQGNYTVNGGTPVTGLIPAGANDYFEFDTNGQFHETLYGMVYPYPCTYEFRADSVLITNNVYAPLDSAKTIVTTHTLRIIGTHTTATGSIISIFSLKR
jgi:hypothetical protein